MTDTSHQRQAGSLHILLVDDDAQICEVLTAFLGLDRHVVEIAENAKLGLELFRKSKFDLVITDKSIPGMSGTEMALEIKQLSPTTPVILLSGYHAEGENVAVPGVDVLATKPISIPALRQAISQAMTTA